MKHRSMFFGAVCAAALLLLPLSGRSQEKAKTEPPAIQGADMEAMMKKWMEAATPGEAHKKLNDMVGKWKTTSRVWMNGLDAPPTETQGSSEVKWVLDGRFLQQEAKGEMMGRPYNGVGFTGYDNMNKKYVTLWIDNTNTAMFIADGTMDQAGKVLTTVGKMDEPATGEHDKSAMYIYRMETRDRHIMEIHDLSLPQGKTKVMEMVYTREK